MTARRPFFSPHRSQKFRSFQRCPQNTPKTGRNPPKTAPNSTHPPSFRGAPPAMPGSCSAVFALFQTLADPKTHFSRPKSAHFSIFGRENRRLETENRRLATENRRFERFSARFLEFSARMTDWKMTDFRRSRANQWINRRRGRDRDRSRGASRGRRTWKNAFLRPDLIGKRGFCIGKRGVFIHISYHYLNYIVFFFEKRKKRVFEAGFDRKTRFLHRKMRGFVFCTFHIVTMFCVFF
jgi:hypothetical protein